MKRIAALVLIMFLAACASGHPPTVEQKVEVKQPDKTSTHAPIIGGVERVYLDGIKTPFHARIDTGAETSSVDVQNIIPFERDGEKWVSFEIVNRTNGEKNAFEKPVKRKLIIKRTGEKERRYVVKLKVKMGKNFINSDFSLNDRSRFDYQVLIGRDILTGRYIVDTSLSNTLR